VEVGVGESVKRFGIWALGAVVAFFVSHGKHNYLILVAYLAVSLIIYLLDCLRAPMRKCWRCGGSGKRNGWLFPDDSGRCLACEGRSGRQPRIGTWLFRLPRH
jgi:uncharacterized membrane protein YbhN (UPF0104 family)